MASKTRTRKTTTTGATGTDRTLRSVPEQTVAAKVRTDTEDKLWKALHASPNSTAVDLSTAATIGKSTAQKILAKWAADGSVTRTSGIAEGGRRAADLWAISAIDSQDDPTPADAPAADDADTTDTARAEPVAPNTPDPDHSTLTEADPVEPEAADLVNAEPAAEVGAPTVDGTATDIETPPEDGADTPSEKKERLAPGGLRGMVEDYLRDHPGEEFGPTAIAKALGGKSSGAVSNALDRLVEVGVATKTQDKPRRFTLAPTEPEAAPTPKK